MKYIEQEEFLNDEEQYAYDRMKRLRSQHRIIRSLEGDPYLIRFNLLSLFGYNVKLHIFVDGDVDRCLHDHPWSFVTIPLLGGYAEHYEDKNGERRFHHVKPLTFNYRPAKYKHRVVLHERDGEKIPAVTLVIMGRRKRTWGFWTKKGFVNYVKFLNNRGGHEC